MPGLAACLLSDKPCERASRIPFDCRADAAIRRPPGASGFDSGAVTIKPEMPEFRLAGQRPVVDCLMDDQSTAHSAAERYVENGIRIPSRSQDRFAQCGDVRIVVDIRRRLGQLA